MAINYMKATNFMFLGGLMMAIGVEHSGLHHRIALKILILVGTSPKMVMLGFMTTTAFLSMWISNTATVAMMLPIVEAVAAAMNRTEVIFFLHFPATFFPYQIFLATHFCTN